MIVKLKWKTIRLWLWELNIHRLEFRDGNEYQWEVIRRRSRCEV